MRKHLILFVAMLLVVGMAGLLGCSKKAEPKQAPSAPATAQPAKPAVDRTGWPVIVAFGDSLTYGQGVSPERNYPSLLQEELDRLGLKYRVVNAGISGDTSAGGAARIDSILRHKPELVILELGANDGLQGKPLDKMRENLQQIIEHLQNEKIKVVLVGMQIPPNYGPEYTAQFRDTFTELASRYKLPLIPFFLDGVAAKPELNLADGIHPTADGYVYVVRKNVLPVLQPLLQKP